MGTWLGSFVRSAGGGVADCGRRSWSRVAGGRSVQARTIAARSLGVRPGFVAAVPDAALEAMMVTRGKTLLQRVARQHNRHLTLPRKGSEERAEGSICTASGQPT